MQVLKCTRVIFEKVCASQFKIVQTYSSLFENFKKFKFLVIFSMRKNAGVTDLPHLEESRPRDSEA